MTRGIFALLPVLLALAACVGDSETPRFAYAANASDNTLSMYTVDALSGRLRHNGYVLTGRNPAAVAIDPLLRFVYVANAGSNDVSAYKMDAATGVLTPIDADPVAPGVQGFATGTAPQSVSVDPSGRFAYVVASGSANVSGYAIDAGTGKIGAVVGSPFAAGSGAGAVAMHPSGRFVYVANQGANDISAYVIDTSTGALKVIDANPIQPGLQNFAAGSTPVAVAIDRQGNFLYIANQGSNNITAYAIGASGFLTVVPGSPFPAGTRPNHVAVDPWRRFVYAANSGIGSGAADISAYSMNTNNGTLTPIDADAVTPGVQNLATGEPFSKIAIEPVGRYVYVTSSVSNQVSSYAIDAVSGALTALRRISTREAPVSLAMTRGGSPVTYTPRFAYVANEQDSVSTFKIDPVTGVLSAMATIPAGDLPICIALDPLGRFAYVTNMNSANVSMFRIDAAGTLTGLGTVPAGRAPTSVAVDPSGRFVYVANQFSETVTTFSIKPTTGTLVEVQTTPIPIEAPLAVTVDPSGRFAYVAGAIANNVWTFRIDPVTGALTAQGKVSAGQGANWVTVHPSGLFTYVANEFSNDVTTFRIDPTKGTLNTVATAAAGNVPVAITVDPTGRFAYATNTDSSDATPYTVNTNSGPLTQSGPGIPVGNTPRHGTVDPSGRFAYFAAWGANNITAFGVDQSTGTLTSLGPAVVGGNAPASIAVLGTIQ